MADPLKADSEIIQFQFARLVFGLRPSPAIFGAVISLHLTKYQDAYPRLVDKIYQSLYVDDLVSGGANVQEVYELYKTAKHIMHQGGFNLHKWNSKLLRIFETNSPS